MIIGGSRLIGLFALIPATVLLTISFFVLVVVRKLEAQALKAFGYVIAALLWLGVALLLSSGIYVISTGRSMMPCMMKGMGPCNMSHDMKGMHERHEMQEMQEGSPMKGEK